MARGRLRVLPQYAPAAPPPLVEQVLLGVHGQQHPGAASQPTFPSPASLHGVAVFSLSTFPARTPAVLGMRVHGTAGRMPNADLAATLSRAAELTPAPAHFGRGDGGPWAAARHAARSFLLAAAGAGDGLHTVFLEAGADAATLDWPLPRPAERGAVRQALRGAEASLRALSNLEERLHHAGHAYWPVGGRHVVDGAALLAAGVACLAAVVLELVTPRRGGSDSGPRMGASLAGGGAVPLSHALVVHLACYLGAACTLHSPRLSAAHLCEAGVVAVAGAAWILAVRGAAGRGAGVASRPVPLGRLTAGLFVIVGPALLLLNAPLLVLSACGCLWTLRAPAAVAPLPAALAVALCLAWHRASSLVFLAAQIASILVCRCLHLLL